jgi:predicted porin
VLLRPGRLRIEPTVNYTYADRARIFFDGLDILDVVFIGTIDAQEAQNQTFTSSITMRYGLSNRLNLRATVPWEWRKTELFKSSRNETQVQMSEDESSGVGDISLGLAYQLYRSDSRLPNVVANLNFSPDTGDSVLVGRGHDQVTGGLTFLAQSDPAALFASVTYIHNQGDFRGFERGDLLGGSLGYSYALNYDLSLSTSFSFLRQIEDSTFATLELGEVDVGRRATLSTFTVGATYALTRRTALALSLGIGLTDDSPELTLTMSLPMAFDTSGWW